MSVLGLPSLCNFLRRIDIGEDGYLRSVESLGRRCFGSALYRCRARFLLLHCATGSGNNMGGGLNSNSPRFIFEELTLLSVFGVVIIVLYSGPFV